MTSNLKKNHYFFIGTDAELIKLAPLMKRMEKKGVPYTIFLSGQNNIHDSLRIWEIHPLRTYDLFAGSIKQTPLGLFSWFIKTFLAGIRKYRSLPELKRATLIVHGDTLSTVMGCLLGKISHMTIVHIESGLRSFDMLSPFPEEIDRSISSRLADVHFAPNDWCVTNLRNRRGIVVNTGQNTLIESLAFAEKAKVSSTTLNKLGDRFGICTIHRQENLYNKDVVAKWVTMLLEISHTYRVLFVLHKPTQSVLSDMNLLTKLTNNPNIVVSQRIQYFELMHIFRKSQFIVTDGGSNQEESYYLGLPCLIFRSKTERIEGLGRNVILANIHETRKIDEFISNYAKYRMPKIPLPPEEKIPSQIILSTLSSLKL